MRDFEVVGTTITCKEPVSEKWLNQSLKRPADFAYFGEDQEEMFKTWSLGPVIEHRDSGLLDRANAKALLGFLKSDPSLGSDYKVTECNHWAVGWVRHLSFRALDGQGEPTRIAAILSAWFTSLKEEYPIANDEIYSEMESEATYDNVASAGESLARRKGYTLPDEWVGLVMDWFDSNDSSALENTDDQGGYPSDEQLQAAFEGLCFSKEVD